MRIGIVSFYDTQHNYGQVLQCYALQQFLIKLGHKPEHIRYAPFKKSKASTLRILLAIVLHGHTLSYLKHLMHSVRKKERARYASMVCPDNARDRGFDDFRKRYICISKASTNYRELNALSINYDALCVGSDQVWPTASRMFCLDFGPPNVKRISYAASMGGNKIEYKYQAYLWKKYLRRFDYISLREQDGVDEIRKIGFKEAQLVLDPTFLLAADDYRKLFGETKNTIGDYLFLYLLGNPIDLNVADIIEWAVAKGLKVVYVASQGRQDVFDKQYVSIEEWLSLIEGAKYVITNSFHGVAFSIIFRKLFLAIPLIGTIALMNNRLIDTLSRLGIGDRIYRKSLDEVCSPIDYTLGNNVIEDNRRKVASDFSSILTSAKRH